MKKKPEDQIDRGRFLRGMGLAALGASAAGSLLECGPAGRSGTGAGNESFEWKMVTTWPKNFPGLGTGANRLAERIERASGGRLRVRVYAAGELVPPFECFDTVSNGTAELGHGASYYWKGKAEAAQFFSAVPFGLNATEMSAWLWFGGAQELWDELYAPFNLRAFACGNTGVQMGGWFNREIRSLTDFQGLVIRMPGLGGEVMTRMGATVQSIPGGEIFQALQSGAIDATEWVGPYNDLAFGFYKAARFYYWPGWHEPGTALELIVNKQAFEGLPEELQEVVQAACKADYAEMTAEFTARNNLALKQLVNQHGVQLRRFPDEVLRKIAQLSEEVVAQIATQNDLSKRIYESYVAFRAGSMEWARIGEQAFSMARSAGTGQ